VFETSRPTTHSAPVYDVDGVLHYAVTNMPGAYARTSTFALTKATIPYIIRLADKGLEAMKEDPVFRSGLNVYKGRITSKGVADAFGMEYVDPMRLL
jgi:alanine dehydrogenase